MSQQHHLTQAAHDRLKAELEHLTTVGRIDIAQQIERARELGDLSENGDYQAAKDQQGMMEGRIRQLEAILKNAIIVPAGTGETVHVGSIVTILYDGDTEDMAETYLFGHLEEKPADRSDLDGVITPESPLGQALNGRQPDEEVEYAGPAGTLKVKILSIEV